MFENPRRCRQARNFTKKCFENSRSQIVFRTDIFRKLSLGAPVLTLRHFFFSGKGEKRTPDTFTSRVVCRPLTKVSVNICVNVMCQILPEVQAVCNEGGSCRNDVYLTALQSSGECHIKLIQTYITDFKDQVSIAVIANLASSLPCGSLVQTVLVKSNKLIIHWKQWATMVAQLNFVFYWNRSP